MCVKTVNGAEQSLSHELFGCLAYFDGLRHSDSEVFRLFNEAPWNHCVRFGCVNEVEAKQVFLISGAHMKAVTVIGGVRDQSAIFQHNPIF